MAYTINPHLRLSFNSGATVIDFSSAEVRDITEGVRHYPDVFDNQSAFAVSQAKPQSIRWKMEVLLYDRNTLDKLRQIALFVSQRYKLSATWYRYPLPVAGGVASYDKIMQRGIIRFPEDWDYLTGVRGSGPLRKSVTLEIWESAELALPDTAGDEMKFDTDPVFCKPAIVVDNGVSYAVPSGDTYICTGGAPTPRAEMIMEWGIGITKTGQVLRNTVAMEIDTATAVNLTVASILVNGASVTLPYTIYPGDAVEAIVSITNPAATARLTLSGDVVASTITDSAAGSWVNYPLADRQNAIVNETYFCTGRYALEANTATTNYDVGAYSLQAFTGKGKITFRAVGRECFYGISPAKTYPVSNIYFRHYYSAYLWPGGLDTYELGSGGGASAYGFLPAGIQITTNSLIGIEVTDNAGGQIIYYHNGIAFRTVARAYNPADVWYVDLSGRYTTETHSPVFIEQL